MLHLLPAATEASWLAALAVVPLYFSGLSGLGGETDRGVVLVVLGTVAGVSWLLDVLLRPSGRTGRLDLNSLVVLGTLAFAAYLVATAFSIDPRMSVFGSVNRHIGLVDRAAALVIFLTAATRLRSRAQLGRALDALILASLPTVVYGLAQQFGIDPLSGPTGNADPAVLQWPVRSTFGQHIFFGTYLVFLAPLTASRLHDVWRRPVTARQGAGDEALLLSLITVFAAGIYLGGIAVAAHAPAAWAILPAAASGYVLLAITWGRVPITASVRQVWLAFLGLLLIFQVVALLLTGARGPFLGLVAAAVVYALLVAWTRGQRRAAGAMLALAIACLAFAALLNVPGGPLSGLRSVAGLSRIAHFSESGGNDSSAQARAQVWSGVRALVTQHPAVGGTWGGVGRDMVGYGPESFQEAFDAVFPLDLRRMTFESYTWDHAHSVYLDTMVDAGLLGLLTLCILVGWAFLTIMRRLRSGDTGSWVPIGLAAALSGYAVQGITGLETGSSLLLLWFVLGLCAGHAWAAEDEAVPAPGMVPRIALPYWGVVLAGGALLALLGGMRDHPLLLAGVWLLALLGGVGAVGAAVQESDAVLRRERGSRAGASPPTDDNRRRLRQVGAGALLTAGVVTLAVQWQFTAGSYAEAAGFRHLTSGGIVDGLADLQTASRLVPYAAKFRQDLATVYAGLATGAGGTAAGPKSVPDPRTFDPTSAETSSRGTLLALAVASLDSAHALQPNLASIDEALGDAYRQWGRPGPALTAYRAAARLSHQNPRYLADQGLALSQAGNPVAALARARAALRLDPHSWFAYYALAKIYHGSHERAQARSAAGFALFWEPPAWPPPPADELRELRSLRNRG